MRKIATGAVVALHEHADRVTTLRVGQLPRRGADAALEPVAHHASAAADRAFPGHPAGCTVERGVHVLRLHVKAVDVVQPAVVGFGDDRQPPRLQDVATRDLPLNDRVAHDADAVRVGDRDRPLEQAALLDPGRAGHLAVAVQREPGGEHGIVVGPAARMDDRDAGANRTLADDELAAAGDQRRVSDLHPGDVGDRVERPCGAADRQLEITLSRLLRL